MLPSSPSPLPPVPSTPFSRLWLFFSLSLSSFRPSPLSLLASPTLLHPCCHSLRKTRPFPPARFHILTRWSLPALSIFVLRFFFLSLSRYINTLISDLVISKLTLSDFHTDLTRIEEIIDNCVNLDSTCTSFQPRPLTSAYFHAGLMQLEEITGNCINFASTCYLPHLLLRANVGNL